MFDEELAASLGEPGALLHLASDTQAAERGAGCRKLQVAAAWADCHGAPVGLELSHGEPAGQSVLVDRFVRMGPIGTPLVAECCPAELALPLQTSVVAARRLIGTALTIRHRLPRLWDRVKAEQVWAWKARQIAEQTAELGLMSARIVDRMITPQVEAMAWGRFQGVLDATILHVDEASYQQRAERAAARRDVRVHSDGDGLRTLVARVEGGDAAAFMALVERVAACLADDGDEDPIGVRRSKAFGVIAHQGRLRDLLARHADQPDDPRHPEQRVADHLADPTDPWAADDLPDAGWQTARHGDYHQPSLDDPADTEDCQDGHIDLPDEPGWDEEPPVDDADLAWHDQNPPAANGWSACPGRLPAAFGGPEGSTFDLRPLTRRDLGACKLKVVVNVHLTDHTLIDQHGVVRTPDGPVTLDQFRRWLTDTDPNITIRPVLDPAATAPVDGYEIPLHLRRALRARHPGSVWPFSPTTEDTTAGHLDLDHTIPYVEDGPPGQTATNNLGPLARSEHRAKTVGGWRARQPDPGTYLWRSPHGWMALTTNQGTLLLGDSPFARQIWKDAQASATDAAS